MTNSENEQWMNYSFLNELIQYFPNLNALKI